MARKLPYIQRARSVPHKGSFIRAVVWISLFFLGVVMSITAAAVFSIESYLNPEPPKILAYTLIASLGLTGVMWVFGYIARKHAICSLCRSTPYLDNGANFHTKAEKIFPINYSHTNCLKSIFFQQFRCQYCGTPYDYLKKHARR